MHLLQGRALQGASLHSLYRRTVVAWRRNVRARPRLPANALAIAAALEADQPEGMPTVEVADRVVQPPFGILLGRRQRVIDPPGPTLLP